MSGVSFLPERLPLLGEFAALPGDLSASLGAFVGVLEGDLVVFVGDFAGALATALAPAFSADLVGVLVEAMASTLALDGEAAFFSIPRFTAWPFAFPESALLEEAAPLPVGVSGVRSDAYWKDLDPVTLDFLASGTAEAPLSPWRFCAALVLEAGDCSTESSLVCLAMLSDLVSSALVSSALVSSALVSTDLVSSGFIASVTTGVEDPRDGGAESPPASESALVLAFACAGLAGDCAAFAVALAFGMLCDLTAITLVTFTAAGGTAFRDFTSVTGLLVSLSIELLAALAVSASTLVMGLAGLPALVPPAASVLAAGSALGAALPRPLRSAFAPESPAALAATLTSLPGTLAAAGFLSAFVALGGNALAAIGIALRGETEAPRLAASELSPGVVRLWASPAFGVPELDGNTATPFGLGALSVSRSFKVSAGCLCTTDVLTELAGGRERVARMLAGGSELVARGRRAAQGLRVGQASAGADDPAGPRVRAHDGAAHRAVAVPPAEAGLHAAAAQEQRQPGVRPDLHRVLEPGELRQEVLQQLDFAVLQQHGVSYPAGRRANGENHLLCRLQQLTGLPLRAHVTAAAADVPPRAAKTRGIRPDTGSSALLRTPPCPGNSLQSRCRPRRRRPTSPCGGASAAAPHHWDFRSESRQQGNCGARLRLRVLCENRRWRVVACVQSARAALHGPALHSRRRHTGIRYSTFTTGFRQALPPLVDALGVLAPGRGGDPVGSRLGLPRERDAVAVRHLGGRRLQRDPAVVAAPKIGEDAAGGCVDVATVVLVAGGLQALVAEVRRVHLENMRRELDAYSLENPGELHVGPMPLVHLQRLLQQVLRRLVVVVRALHDLVGSCHKPHVALNRPVAGVDARLAVPARHVGLRQVEVHAAQEPVALPVALALRGAKGDVVEVCGQHARRVYNVDDFMGGLAVLLGVQPDESDVPGDARGVVAPALVPAQQPVDERAFPDVGHAERDCAQRSGGQAASGAPLVDPVAELVDELLEPDDARDPVFGVHENHGCHGLAVGLRDVPVELLALPEVFDAVKVRVRDVGDPRIPDVEDHVAHPNVLRQLAQALAEVAREPVDARSPDDPLAADAFVVHSAGALETDGLPRRLLGSDLFRTGGGLHALPDLAVRFQGRHGEGVAVAGFGFSGGAGIWDLFVWFHGLEEPELLQFLLCLFWPLVGVDFVEVLVVDWVVHCVGYHYAFVVALGALLPSGT
ncbi:beta-glucosidase [Babesia caballi]|uniref:Beta-glucosidase n=1 Tax=Babesia caballi TaxID=5871 RepID=A0AAV4LWT6_BABCB|nr:beta-glucosidase [Babesia caballi]